MTRALITTVPFGEVDSASLVLLDEAGEERSDEEPGVVLCTFPDSSLRSEWQVVAAG